MRTVLMVTTIWALCACTPAPSNTAPPAATAAAAPAAAEAANGCPARATSTWNGGGADTYSIEASAQGATCAEAQATLIIRDAHGALEQSFSLGAADTLVLAGAESVQDMQRRLTEWITPAGASADSTGDLPEWAAGAEGPSPFTPTLGMGRAEYQALRAQDAPMYCYEASATTSACFAVHNGGLTQIGVQTYEN